MNDLNTIPYQPITMHPIVPHLYTNGFKYVFATFVRSMNSLFKDDKVLATNTLYNRCNQMI